MNYLVIIYLVDGRLLLLLLLADARRIIPHEPVILKPKTFKNYSTTLKTN